MSYNPKNRLKFIILAFFSVFFVNLLLFIIVEHLDILNAFYFLIVTITTVGFGDIIPHSPITKLSVIVLIIIGILSIGYLSEFVINNLLASKSIELPVEGLNVKKHVIITPFNNLGQKIARLSLERSFLPIIIDENEELINLAHLFGLVAYQADIRRADVLERLQLQESEAMFLLMEDDNDIIQTSIIAKTYCHDLPIFAQVSLETANDIDPHYMGITKSFQYETIVAFTLQFYFNKFKYYAYDHQREPESVMKLLEVAGNIEIVTEFPDAMVLGEIDNKLRTLEPVKDLKIKHANNPENNVLIAIPREIYDKYSNFKNQVIEYQSEKIIFGGFPKILREILPLLSFPKENIVILTFSQEEQEIAFASGYVTTFIPKKDIINGIRENIKSNDMLINAFELIADSLLLIHSINHLPDINPRIIQLVYHEFELRVFRNTDVDRIILYDNFVARNMFIPLIRIKQMTTTFTFNYAHFFEHIVKKGDELDGKSLIRLEKKGISIMLFRAKNSTTFTKSLSHKKRLQPGDYAIMLIRPPKKIIEKTRSFRQHLS